MVIIDISLKLHKFLTTKNKKEVKVMTVQKKQVKTEPEIRFENAKFKCKCGYEGEETILVGNSVGVLDTKCPKCERRILEFRIIDEQK